MNSNSASPRRPWWRIGLVVVTAAMVWVACTGESDTTTEPATLDGAGASDGTDDVTSPIVTPSAPSVPRLTQLQYRNVIHDVLGTAIVVPVNLEPDQDVAGFVTIGAGQSTISPRGVEQYEEAAYDIASQAFAPENRDRIVSCEPSGAVDDACAQSTMDVLGARLWRRPLSDEESARLVAVARQASERLNDFYVGLE
ncbi:MAG: DUF1587 domain-containing protein, partial [Myxococcota bacterium]